MNGIDKDLPPNAAPMMEFSARFSLATLFKENIRRRINYTIKPLTIWHEYGMVLRSHI
jgi:hypothetical protein